MPRRKQNYIPGLPYHVVQRGNNRQPCFYQTFDYERYLDLWRKKSAWYGVEVHAYCLMANHVHFIVTGQDADAISNTMKVVGSCYAQDMNRRYKRTGTLWEGRHRSSLIDSQRYLLTCYRYVELNPVRAGLTSKPADYLWSSYHCNAEAEQSWLTPHEIYLALAPDRIARAVAYRSLFASKLKKTEVENVQRASHYSLPLGDEAFLANIEQHYGVPRGQYSRGRPSKRLAKQIG